MEKAFTDMFRDKTVLVAGGTGLIGTQLIELLIKEGARIRVASLDTNVKVRPEVHFVSTDLRIFENCLRVCSNVDYVFNLLCVKGSPAMHIQPASFFVPMMMFNTNLMEAARQSSVSGFLFTSSVAVYMPAEVLYEDKVWETFPSKNDWFAGWAKRMGELQAEAYAIEYNWRNIAIVRPSNVYGPHDNFHGPGAMVIPSLIKRAVDGEDPLVVWGDGSAERDFIHAKDVAMGMLLAAKHPSRDPINLGAGVGTSIKDLVEIIVDNLDSKPKVIWDKSKPSGDRKRVMDISRAKTIGFNPCISLREGIAEVMEWYQENKDKADGRYNIFK